MHTASHCRYSESSKMQQPAAEDPGPLGKRHHRKSQSAMEYLMTYGWSILIIAVVLGALAYLGVFNPLYFAPKANSGSCQAFRPNGAGTSYDINLLGVCNGEIPEYTAQLNGQTSYIQTSQALQEFQNNYSISLWIDPTGYSGLQLGIMQFGSGGNGADGWILSDSGGSNPYIYFDRNGWITPSYKVSLNSWINVVVIANAESSSSILLSLYVNKELVGTTLETSALMPVLNSNIAYVGSGNGGHFDGYISNVQFYNTSLDWPSVNAIYQEGIGGAPIDLQNLVGWWPLNGNANDYSGNGNNGVPTNVVYTSSWISSYNPP